MAFGLALLTSTLACLCGVVQQQTRPQREKKERSAWMPHHLGTTILHGGSQRRRQCFSLGAARWGPIPLHTLTVASAAGGGGDPPPASQDTDWPEEPAFFDRESELENLNKLTQRLPTAITVLLGPRSGGKTRLLRQFMEAKGTYKTRCYIDCRRTSVITPGDMVKALITQSLPVLSSTLSPDAWQKIFEVFKQSLSSLGLREKIAQFGDLTIGGKELALLLSMLFDERKPGGSEFSQLLDAYEVMLDQWFAARKSDRRGDKFLTIVIDEANVLSQWTDVNSRNALLRFFTAITKQNALRAHVILATSDYAFQYWARDEIGAGYYKLEVIGGFPKSTARRFFNQLLVERRLDVISDGAWDEVFRVCGGVAGILVSVAESFLLMGSLDQALALELKGVENLIRSKSTPASNAGYTREHFMRVSQVVVASKFHAVQEWQAIRRLDHNSDALLAMVKANLFGHRPYSTWAYDINKLAFGPKSLDVVTAPTPVHLLAMESLLADDVADEGTDVESMVSDDAPDEGSSGVDI